MTRDELIEVMARAMDVAAGTHSAAPFAVTWGEHATAALSAIEATDHCIMPVEATEAEQKAARKAAPPFWRDTSQSEKWFAKVRRAMIEAGKI